MKKKSLKLSLPSPCETPVTEMFQVLDGKFCKGCKRVVIDFRKMSDKDLLDYFKDHRGKICGEFRPHQLDREISMHTPSAIDIFRQKTAAVAAITSLALVVPVAQMNAQSQHEIIEQPLRGKINPASIPIGNQPDSLGTDQKVSGKVVDENGEAVISANVFLEGTSIGTTTDLKGEFQLTCVDSLSQKTGTYLTVSYAGYITEKIAMRSFKSLEKIKIVLEPSIPLNMVGGLTVGVLIYEENPTTIGDTIIKQEVPSERIDSMSVFPNPFSQTFHVKTELSKKDLYELFLFDEAGKVYWSESRKLRAGLNEIEVKIPSSLPPGNYIFHLRSKEMQLSEMIVKAE